MKLTATESHTVTRGPDSWAYIYIVLGFAIAIEASVIAQVEPLKFPWNLIAFLLVAGITTWALLTTGWLQNKLIGLKLKYENKARKV